MSVEDAFTFLSFSASFSVLKPLVWLAVPLLSPCAEGRPRENGDGAREGDSRGEGPGEGPGEGYVAGEECTVREGEGAGDIAGEKCRMAMSSSTGLLSPSAFPRPATLPAECPSAPSAAGFWT